MAEYQIDPTCLQPRIQTRLPDVKKTVLASLGGLIGVNTFLHIDPEEIGLITRLFK